MRTVTEVLKVSCKKAHVATEKTLIEKLKSISSLEHYTNILAIFYGYFAPTEEAILKQITPAILPDVLSRKRSLFIISDLQKLKYTTPLKVSKELPGISNYAQAAGAMYVLEGSTLGGQHIARMLEAKPVLQEHKDAMSFFKGYGNENMSMWQSFKDCLDNSINNEDVETVVQSAIETFELLDKWTLNKDNDRIKNN